MGENQPFGYQNTNENHPNYSNPNPIAFQQQQFMPPRIDENTNFSHQNLNNYQPASGTQGSLGYNQYYQAGGPIFQGQQPLNMPYNQYMPPQQGPNLVLGEQGNIMPFQEASTQNMLQIQQGMPVPIGYNNNVNSQDFTKKDEE